MTTPHIKPSDAKSWSLCARRVWLDNKGNFETAPPEDEFEQLVIDLGLNHEQTVLERLSQTYDVHTASSVDDTNRFMEEGVDVIYQGQLIDTDENFSGYPDFLIRTESGDYQPADAKLSLSEEKKEIQVQLGFYRRILGNGLPAIVYLGDGSEAIISDEANTITNRFVTQMREILNSDTEPTVRYSHSKCRACHYYTHCKPFFEEKEDLSLLYGIQGRVASGLENEGIESITTLANTNPTTIPDIPYLKGFEKKLVLPRLNGYFIKSDNTLRSEVCKKEENTVENTSWWQCNLPNSQMLHSHRLHIT